MTDTVNVPRDVIERLTAVAEGGGPNDVYGSETFVDVGYAFRADLSAMLAAAPKAEPDYRKLVRDVDRMHEDGTIPPEAPKVEQEPYAWAIEVDSTARGLFYEKTEADFDANIEGGVVQPLYTNPAPVSDELLEALETEIERLRPHYQGRGLNEARVQMLDHFASFIAKHKGPQS